VNPDDLGGSPRALPVVFLLDVDNTLLDNDGFSADLNDRLEHVLGAALKVRYWALYDEIRKERDYADYFAPLERLRSELADDQGVLTLSEFILDYPFVQRLYPSALEAIRHLTELGQPVVLSDGDVVLQPQKIRRSGIWEAVGGRVLIYAHKERHVDAVQRHYPAARYVMIDDKPAILAGMKRALGDRVTTVFVQQGHYAREAAGQEIVPAPDLGVAYIGDLLDWTNPPTIDPSKVETP
jgi:FMN phosphatase YigB (HAD superfamily)